MPETLSNHESYILFELAGTTYGLRSQEVQHMEIVEHITPVPNAPPFVEGVVFSRGQVIPAINLRVRFGFARQAHTLRSRLIVVQAGERRVGLIVDTAREFRNLAPESILPPEQAITGVNENYLQGIAPLGDRLIFLLNIAELLKFAGGEGQRRNLESAPTC
ncbi:MAG TPA: chemotaxis protein CheW [Candidatus Sulfotelmatobacter sp.]|nr:chemotaxis protein CheW [Candidatus Sulfotelmatobacter sp.]